MHSHVILPFVLALFAHSAVLAQASPDIQWQRTFGGSADDVTYSNVPTSDGGCVVVGTTESTNGDVVGNHGGKDVWVVRFDAYGMIKWQRALGGTSTDEGRDVEKTLDGGYLVVGVTSSNNGDVTGLHGGIDFLVVKLDAEGSVEWSKTLGGSGADYAMSVSATDDGGYFVAGFTTSSDGDVSSMNGSVDYWVVRLDAVGEIIWERSYGGSFFDYCNSVRSTLDGGCIMVGVSDSYDQDVISSYGGNNVWIIKLNALGEIEWQRSKGGGGADFGYHVIQAQDGRYVIAASSNSANGDLNGNMGVSDAWVIVLDNSGELVWQRSFGGSSDEELSSVSECPDGGFIFAGRSYSVDGHFLNRPVDKESWLLKLDSEGNVRWEAFFGGGEEDGLPCVSSVSGGYIATGSTSSTDGDVSNNQGSSDAWMLRVVGNLNTITGSIYCDLNSNSSWDANENAIPYHKLITQVDTLLSWTGSQGAFALDVYSPGMFQVEPEFLSYYSSVPEVHTATFSGLNEIDPVNDFAFQPIGNFNDLFVSILPLTPFRPGFSGTYQLRYRNIGTTTIAPNVGFQFVQPFSYLSASLEPTAITVDSVSWQLPALEPFEEGSIEVTVSISSTAVLGSTIIAAATIFPLEGDANIADNKALWWVQITGSYDPNDIQVDRPEISPEELADGVDLTYLIRFQNTGTDTAFTVRVDNPVPVNADFDTFDFIAASHPVQISYAAATSKLSFLFDNILLPDSNTNEPESHGYILYRIKPRPTLVLGDSVLNQVGIYFDFNLPIITNVAHTVIEQRIGISAITSQSSPTLFPNPTTGEVMLRLPRPVSNGAVTVTDAMGRTVLQTTMTGSAHRLDLRPMPSGVYLIAVQDDEGGFQQRVVVE